MSVHAGDVADLKKRGKGATRDQRMRTERVDRLPVEAKARKRARSHRHFRHNRARRREPKFRRVTARHQRRASGGEKGNVTLFPLNDANGNDFRDVIDQRLTLIHEGKGVLAVALGHSDRMVQVGDLDQPRVQQIDLRRDVCIGL